jgi:hypothetical protein
MSGEQQLEHLAKLIQTRDIIDSEMAAMIGRPAQIGHLGEFIASRIFDIGLDESASRKSIDGYFMSGSLAGRSVNIKWYGKLESMLDITPGSLPDYYLVLTGPRSVALTSRGGVRPLVIEHVFLFEATELVRVLAGSGIKLGIATSVRRHLWDMAEIYPRQRCPDLVLTEEQRTLLALFSEGAER